MAHVCLIFSAHIPDRPFVTASDFQLMADHIWIECCAYRQTTSISHTLDNKIEDHSDVVGASPVGVAPTTSSLS